MGGASPAAVACDFTGCAESSGAIGRSGSIHSTAVLDGDHFIRLDLACKIAFKPLRNRTVLFSCAAGSRIGGMRGLKHLDMNGHTEAPLTDC
jgi:hypothetical protein